MGGVWRWEEMGIEEKGCEKGRDVAKLGFLEMKLILTEVVLDI